MAYARPGKTRRRARIWVISHCEIFVMGRTWRVDEMVHGAARSLRRAVLLIQTLLVEAGSWWRIEETGVGDLDTFAPSRFYSRGGRLLSQAPVHQGIRAWPRKRAKQLAFVRDSLREARQRGDARLVRTYTVTLKAMLQTPRRLTR